MSQPLNNAIAAQSLCAIHTLDMASFEPIEPQNDIYEAHNFGYRVATSLLSSSTGATEGEFEEDYDADSIHASGPVTSYIVNEQLPGDFLSKEIYQVHSLQSERDDFLADTGSTDCASS